MKDEGLIARVRRATSDGDLGDLEDDDVDNFVKYLLYRWLPKPVRSDERAMASLKGIIDGFGLTPAETAHLLSLMDTLAQTPDSRTPQELVEKLKSKAANPQQKWTRADSFQLLGALMAHRAVAEELAVGGAFLRVPVIVDFFRKMQSPASQPVLATALWAEYERLVETPAARTARQERETRQRKINELEELIAKTRRELDALKASG